MARGYLKGQDKGKQKNEKMESKKSRVDEKIKVK